MKKQSPIFNPESMNISGTIGYWIQGTVPTTDLSTGFTAGNYPDAVAVSTDGAQVTGKPASVGTTGTAVISPPLATNMWHPMAFASVSAITAGNVWFGWYNNPNAT